jgi:hypothetical protein
MGAYPVAIVIPLATVSAAKEKVYILGTASKRLHASIETATQQMRKYAIRKSIRVPAPLSLESCRHDLRNLENT